MRIGTISCLALFLCATTAFAIPVTSTSAQRPIPVLVYHHVRELPPNPGPDWVSYCVVPAEFDKQMQLLRQYHYQVISMATLVQALKKEIPWPEKAVVLTFDDGWIDQGLHAFAILQKYGYTATFYVFTNAIGREKYLGWEMLKQFMDAGMEVASHTRFHPYLTRISEAELQSELSIPIAKIAEKLHFTTTNLAYPFGLYNAHVIDDAVKAGYTVARGFAGGFAKPDTKLMEIPGMPAPNSSKRFEHWLQTLEH